MSMIFVTDFHYGIDIINGTTLRGSFAHELHQALIDYAHESDIRLIVDGGDQSSYTAHEDKHIEQAQAALRTANTFRGDYATAIGNHEPRYAPVLKEMGHKTHLVTQQALERTDIIVHQPRIKQTTAANGNPLNKYWYGNNRLTSALQEADQPNLIITGHWAYDRVARGLAKKTTKTDGRSVYRYLDTTHNVLPRLHAQNEMVRQSMLTLHGHEHRFSLTDTLGFQCLAMPSISQADAENERRPCGLFATIHDGKMYGLSARFHKLTLPEVGQGHNYRVEEVSEDYMRQRYGQPYALAA